MTDRQPRDRGQRLPRFLFRDTIMSPNARLPFSSGCTPRTERR